MKSHIVWIIIFQLCAVALFASSKHIYKQEDIKKSLPFKQNTTDRKLVIDNVNGFIRIAGYHGNSIELTIHKTIRAKSESAGKQAEQEVKLDISANNNAVELYVDGLFRRGDGRVNYRGWEFYGYEVTYDFEIQVPMDVDIWAKTINDGKIEIKQVSGDFDVENINGGILMENMSGSGKAYALNKGVTVYFDSNPEHESYFGSLNGDVRVYFKKPLSAEFRLKTFNGSVYSDFDVHSLTPRAFSEIEKAGKTVYKSDSFFGVAAGTGGPEIVLDAFNGDIFILEH
ncbi:hypothetical protein JW960_19195 [candidate division KSB1 bacterium]|nr:hypothetical protein [candidate division KSB1 bacterium]